MIGKLLYLIKKKISAKIIFWLFILTSLTTVAILFSTVVRVTNDNVKVTKDNLDMLSVSIFQNLRNIMNTGDLKLIRKTENDARMIEGVYKLDVIKSRELIQLYSSNEEFTKDKEILKIFQTRKEQVIETNDSNGHFLRMIKPMIATAECLVCHTNQYSGDVIGIIDLSFSLKNADDNLNNIINNIVMTSVLLGLITVVIIFFIVRHSTAPIEGLKRGFERLLKADESFNNLKLSVRSSDEIAEVATLFNQYMDKLHHDLEDEIARQVEQEKLLVKKEKTAALGEMMDAIAHQWKQPLNSISLQIQQLELKIDLEETITNEDVKKSGGFIHKQINHLITTIDEFRQFFRPNQQKVSVNIHKSLDYVVKLMKDVLIGNKIDVEINSDKNLEYMLIETEFKHIFINLISNTKDAFNDNEIDMENRKIIFDIFKEENQLKITTTDNAGGIPDKIIDNIFKANVTSKDEGKGTGIGLYIVTQIIEKLNGNINVENITYQDENKNTQKGAKFTVSLPL